MHYLQFTNYSESAHTNQIVLANVFTKQTDQFVFTPQMALLVYLICVSLYSSDGIRANTQYSTWTYRPGSKYIIVCWNVLLHELCIVEHYSNTNLIPTCNNLR